MIEQIRPFSAIKYTTSNGENCIATKKDGIVTIQGDKNGVRQMPLNEFMDVFVKDQSQKTLERIPNTVSFSGNHADKPKKSRIWALGLAALTGGIFLLSKGKVKKVNINQVADNIVSTGRNLKPPVITIPKNLQFAGSHLTETKKSVSVAENALSELNRKFNPQKPVAAAKNEKNFVLDALYAKPDAKTDVVKVRSQKTEMPDVKKAETISSTSKAKTTQSAVENADDILLSPSNKQKSVHGQDINDPFNPLNAKDFTSPYYKQKGVFGQDINDPFNPIDPFGNNFGLNL